MYVMPKSEDVALKLVEVFRGELDALKDKKRWSDSDKKNFDRMKEAIRIVKECRK